MDKEELLKRLGWIRYADDIEDIRYKFYNRAVDTAINIAERLDEPEKPVVPQFVADWYEENKRDFEIQVYALCVKWYEDKLPEDLNKWFTLSSNKPIQTLVNMHQLGYEVEKEKLYVVAIPDEERNKFIQLWKNKAGKLFFNFVDKIKYGEVNLLTEEEIKQKDEHLLHYAKEVENNE